MSMTISSNAPVAAPQITESSAPAVSFSSESAIQPAPTVINTDMRGALSSIPLPQGPGQIIKA